MSSHILAPTVIDELSQEKGLAIIAETTISSTPDDVIARYPIFRTPILHQRPDR